MPAGGVTLPKLHCGQSQERVHQAWMLGVLIPLLQRCKCECNSAAALGTKHCTEDNVARLANPELLCCLDCFQDPTALQRLLVWMHPTSAHYENVKNKVCVRLMNLKQDKMQQAQNHTSGHRTVTFCTCYARNQRSVISFVDMAVAEHRLLLHDDMVHNTGDCQVPCEHDRCYFSVGLLL